MSHIIGIDFGSTNTTVAYADDDEIIVIPDGNGNLSFPSIVSIKDDGEFLVGFDAQKKLILYPEETFFGIKRLLGLKPGDYVTENHPEIICKDGIVCIKSNNKTYSPELIASAILKKAKEIAENYLNEEIKEAIVTIPTYFNVSQRHAIKKAGEMAGLKIKRFINSSTAAAVTYGTLARDTRKIYQKESVITDGILRSERVILKDKKIENNGKIMVIDFGGGTLDVSILEVGDGVCDVLSTCGNKMLGGEDFDAAIAKHIISDIAEKYGRCLQNNSSTRRRILGAAKMAKEDLSSSKTVEINIPYLLKTRDGLSDYNGTLSQENLKVIVADLLNKVRELIEQAITDASITNKKSIDRVVLVGGMARMSIIREVIKEYFGKEPSCDINPNTAVAMGVAILGGVLAGDFKNVLLLDVTPLSFGVEMKDGIVSPLIKRNSTIPTSVTETFTTTDKNSTNIKIHIVQGESGNAHDNESVGYITVDDLNPNLKGEQKIEVTFLVDSDGILKVSAENKSTHRKVSIIADGDIETIQKVEYTDDYKRAGETSDGKKHWWNKK